MNIKIKNTFTIQTAEECKDELPSKSTGMHESRKVTAVLPGMASWTTQSSGTR